MGEDDEQAWHADSPEPARVGSGYRGRRRVILAAFFTVLTALVVGGGFAVATAIRGGEETPVDIEAGPPSGAALPVQPPADPCPDRVDGAMTFGDGAGGQGSGAAAIEAFNHNYYVTRSAKAAKAVTTAGAIADEPDLQRAINEVPRGTTHCLAITDQGKGRYQVSLTTTPPDGEQPIVFDQIVETTRAGGRWWIEQISKDDK